ncbi:MAG TPA: hypothetical protein VGI79_22645 [Caulobacteraceae bacterium]|jgi:hypothetical protein
MLSPQTLDAIYVYLREVGGFYGSLIGGIIAGALTLAGGLLAYRAGARQAAATRAAGADQVAAVKAAAAEQVAAAEAAAQDQVAAMQRQLDHEMVVKAERDGRTRRAFTFSLWTEATRLKLVLSLMRQAIQHQYPGDTVARIIAADVAAKFAIEVGSELRSGLLADLDLDANVRVTAVRLFAALDDLNAILRVRTIFDGLRVSEVVQAIEKAEPLTQALADTGEAALGRETGTF